jgi:hypothetical protein
MQNDILPTAPPLLDPVKIAARSLEAVRRIDRALIDGVEPVLVFQAAPPLGAQEQ